MPRPAQAGAPESQFRGVSWDESKRMWRARIYTGTPRRQVHIGRFPTELEAAQAYDCYAAAFRESGGDAESSAAGGLNFGLDQAARQLPAFQTLKAFANARRAGSSKGRAEAPAAAGGVRKPAAAAAGGRAGRAARAAQGAAAGAAPPRAGAAAGPKRSRKAARASQLEAQDTVSGGSAVEPQTPPAAAGPQQQNLLLHRLGQVQRTRQQQEQRLQLERQQQQQQQLQMQMQQHAAPLLPPPSVPALLPPTSEEPRQRSAPPPPPAQGQPQEERQLLRWRLERELQLRRQQLDELQQLARALAVPLEPWQDQLQGMLPQAAAEAPPLIPALAPSSEDSATLIDDIWTTALGCPFSACAQPPPPSQERGGAMLAAGGGSGFEWAAPSGAAPALERAGSAGSDGTYASFDASPTRLAAAAAPGTAPYVAAQWDAQRFEAAGWQPAAAPAASAPLAGAFHFDEPLLPPAGPAASLGSGGGGGGWAPAARWGGAGAFAAAAPGACAAPAGALACGCAGFAAGLEAPGDEFLEMLLGDWLDDDTA